jgi:hypothetical protein
MRLPTSNNNLGINSYSNLLGQPEPAYGAVEKAKVLDKLAPVGSPQALNAPKRAQRRAEKQKPPPGPEPVAPTAGVPPQASGPGVASPEVQYQQDMLAFWQEAAGNPEANDTVKQYGRQLFG